MSFAVVADVVGKRLVALEFGDFGGDGIVFACGRGFAFVIVPFVGGIGKAFVVFVEALGERVAVAAVEQGLQALRHGRQRPGNGAAG